MSKRRAKLRWWLCWEVRGDSDYPSAIIKTLDRKPTLLTCGWKEGVHTGLVMAEIPYFECERWGIARLKENEARPQPIEIEPLRIIKKGK